MHGRRVVVVVPAWQAERTLARVVGALPAGVADAVLVVDDGSTDRTTAVALGLGLPVRRHPVNRGYGANQRTAYRWALAEGADVVVMLHGDDQYPAGLVGELAAPVARGEALLALGTRMVGDGARRGGMPLHKRLANRGLSAAQNALLGVALSEHHSGFRAWSRPALEALPLDRMSDGFGFDAEALAWAAAAGWPVVELPIPTRYAEDSSSIGGRAALAYAARALGVSAQGGLARRGLRVGLFGDGG